MTTLYLYLSLFTSHLFLNAALVIKEEQTESKETPPSLEAESTDQKPTFFIMMSRTKTMKEDNDHGKAYTSQSFQGKLSYDANIKGRFKGSSAEKSKRSFAPMNAEHEFDGCRREDMIIHTTELGLPSKFIYPKSFNAYQCKGKCSLKQPGKYIIHSVLKAFLEEKKGIKDDRDACCVPTKLRPMPLIYYVENRGFVNRTFQDIIVEDCGCY